MSASLAPAALDERSRSMSGVDRQTMNAMATTVELLVPAPNQVPQSGMETVASTFEAFEQACTRFDPDSPLMTANQSPDEWHSVPRQCLSTVIAANHAYQVTGGLFDPRILNALTTAGYDHSLPFRDGPVEVTQGNSRPATDEARSCASPWRPSFDFQRSRVCLGGDRIDLGGIGKSCAVMHAVPVLRDLAESFLLNAGGDCYAHGSGPDDDAWQVGVEDPLGGSKPVAVLGLRDAACATSSTRLRRWTVDGQPSHHLIDPRTGRPGDQGLASVTVVAPDTVNAEVWSKALFLSGQASIKALAESKGLAALWVGTDGALGFSAPMAGSIRWQVPDDR